MPFNELSSYRECSKSLGDLADLIETIRDAEPYAHSDARYSTLRHCREAVISARMVVTALANFQEKSLSRDQFEQLFGAGPPDEASKKLSESLRLGLTVLCQFQIEHLFKCMLQALGHSSPTGYYMIAQQLTRSVTLTDSSRAFRVLYTAAILRNSLHSNCVHTDPRNSTWVEEIDGFEFKFIKGQKVDCAGWNHILHLYRHVFTIVQQVVGSSEVRALVDEVSCGP